MKASSTIDLKVLLSLSTLPIYFSGSRTRTTRQFHLSSFSFDLVSFFREVEIVKIRRIGCLGSQWYAFFSSSPLFDDHWLTTFGYFSSQANDIDPHPNASVSSALLMSNRIETDSHFGAERWLRDQVCTTSSFFPPSFSLLSSPYTSSFLDCSIPGSVPGSLPSALPFSLHSPSFSLNHPSSIRSPCSRRSPSPRLQPLPSRHFASLWNLAV